MNIIVKNLVIFAIGIVVISAEKKPCCYSKQFFSHMTIIAGTVKNGSTIPDFTKNELMVDYDKNMRRERAFGNFTIGFGKNKTTTSYKAWNDYTTGKRYILNGTACLSYPLPPTPYGDGQFDNCVPDSFQWKASYFMGSINEPVLVNVWEGIYHNLRTTFVTTENDCTLVSLTRYGENFDGSRFVENQQFHSFTQGRVSSPDALDLPKSCSTK